LKYRRESSLIATVHKINKTENTQVKMLWTEFKSEKHDRCFNNQFATAHEQRDYTKDHKIIIVTENEQF
jgi:hypothetical protein